MIEAAGKLKPEEKRANVEEQARKLYEIWRHRTGLETAFDRLAPRALEAWLEIGRATTDADDPHCAACGGPMRCLRNCAEDKGI